MIIAHIWVCCMCVDFSPTLLLIIIFIIISFAPEHHVLFFCHLLALLAPIRTYPFTDLQVSVTTHSSSSSVSLSSPFILFVSSWQPLLPLIKHLPFLVLLSLALFNSGLEVSLFPEVVFMVPILGYDGRVSLFCNLCNVAIYGMVSVDSHFDHI